MRYFILFLLSIQFIIGCTPIAKRSRLIKAEKSTIPLNFRGDSFYLVGILHNRNSYDRYLKKAFEKRYTGNYILVTNEELEKKYTDVQKYRYVFDYLKADLSYGKSTSIVTGKEKYVEYSTYKFYVIDRTTSTKYQSNRNGDAFFYEIQAYLMLLDAERKAK
jgi:hypothetical protein